MVFPFHFTKSAAPASSVARFSRLEAYDSDLILQQLGDMHPSPEIACAG
jgi:hypothetical protein